MVAIIITQNTTLFAGGGSVSASILCYKWYISYTVMMIIFNLLCIVHNNNYNNYHNNYYYIILHTLVRQRNHLAGLNETICIIHELEVH